MIRDPRPERDGAAEQPHRRRYPVEPEVPGVRQQVMEAHPPPDAVGGERGAAERRPLQPAGAAARFAHPALGEDVDLHHGHDQQHVHPQQACRGAQQPQLAVPVLAAVDDVERQQHHGGGEQRLQTALETHQGAIVQGVVERRQPRCRQPAAGSRGREIAPGQPPHQDQVPEQRRQGQQLDRQAAEPERQRQRVDRDHQRHPQGLGEPFDRIAGAGPGEPVTRGQVAGIGHGDHGVVEQTEDPMARGDEGAPEDEPAAPRRRAGEQRPESRAGFFGGAGRHAAGP